MGLICQKLVSFIAPAQMLLSSDPITVTFGDPASHLLISMANTEQMTFLHIALWLKVCDISNETNDLFYL